MGCKGSGVPWKTVQAKIEEGGRVSISASVNFTGTGSFDVEMEGPAEVLFTREDGTTVKKGKLDENLPDPGTTEP